MGTNGIRADGGPTLGAIANALADAGHGPACVARARGITPGTISACNQRRKDTDPVADSAVAAAWLNDHGGCSCRAATPSTPRTPRNVAPPPAPPDPTALVGQVISSLAACVSVVNGKRTAMASAQAAYDQAVAFASQRHNGAAAWIAFAGATGKGEELRAAMEAVFVAINAPEGGKSDG